MLLKLFLPVFLIFLKVINKNFKITYVAHIYGWHYISTGQYCYRTNEIGTKIVSPSGLIWNFFVRREFLVLWVKREKTALFLWVLDVSVGVWLSLWKQEIPVTFHNKRGKCGLTQKCIQNEPSVGLCND